MGREDDQAASHLNLRLSFPQKKLERTMKFVITQAMGTQLLAVSTSFSLLSLSYCFPISIIFDAPSTLHGSHSPSSKNSSECSLVLIGLGLDICNKRYQV